MSLFDAKTHLSGVVASLVSGDEGEVRILRHGKPVAVLRPIAPVDVSRRIGYAKGKFKVPQDIDHDNPVIAAMFGAGETKDARSS
jgi:antitoxin (DNA-binding transcriptional repressor) of toxin-antitoxin stability system